MIILFLFSIISLQAQQLIKVIGFISNGAITPPYVYIQIYKFFNASNWEGYKEEQITNKGLQQMLILGQQASQKYGSLFQNKAGICKNESIQSFFRLYDINIKSGMSYLRGLCFSNDQQFFKYTFDTYLLPFIQNSDDAKNYSNLTDYVKFEIYDNIEDIVQGNEEYFETDDILVCPNIQQLLQNQLNQNTTKTQIQKQVPKIKRLSDTIIKKNITTYEQQVDALFELRKRYLEYKSYKFAGQKVPYNLTSEIVLLYQVDYFLSQYQVQLGSLELIQLQSSKIVSQILNFQISLSQNRLLQQNTNSTINTNSTSSTTPANSTNSTPQTNGTNPINFTNSTNSTNSTISANSSNSTNTTLTNLTNSTDTTNQNNSNNLTESTPSEDKKTSQPSELINSTQDTTQNQISNKTENQTQQINNVTANETNNGKGNNTQNPAATPSENQNQTQNQSNQAAQNQTENNVTVQPDTQPEPVPAEPKIDVDKIYTISKDGISLYFIDEVQFAAILKVLLTYQELVDLSYGSIPQFAANIYLEYYKSANTYDVAIKYNGRVLKNLKQCPQATKQSCSMIDFTKLISQYAVDHLDLLCQ